LIEGRTRFLYSYFTSSWDMAVCKALAVVNLLRGKTI